MRESEPTPDKRPLTAEDLLAAASSEPPGIVRQPLATPGRNRRRRAFWWKLMVLLWLATAAAALCLVAAATPPPPEAAPEHPLLSFLNAHVKTIALAALGLFGASIFSMVVFWAHHRIVTSAVLEEQLTELSQSMVMARKKRP